MNRCARALGVGLTLCAEASAFAQTPQRPTVAATQIKIAALKADRARLQEELRTVLTEDAKLVDAPPGDILIGLPTTLVKEIASEAITGPLRNVLLTLKNVVQVTRKDAIKTKTFLGMMTLGNYELTVYVQEVKARMKPQTPSLIFGSNRILVDLPVDVESGDVKATLIFKWDGKKLAGIVCGDLTSEHELQASVPRIVARLHGRLLIESRGEQLVVTPVLAPIELAFKVEPQQRTWDFIDDLIESRNAACQAALRKAAVGDKVKALVAQGFKTKLASNWLKPITLLASFRDTVEVGRATAKLAVTPTGVSITKTRIWYGANLLVKRGPDSGRKPAGSS
ncbi:MAG: hypothetical protein ABIR28_05375 [Vicinamibacteria bacterium]